MLPHARRILQRSLDGEGLGGGDAAGAVDFVPWAPSRSMPARRGGQDTLAGIGRCPGEHHPHPTTIKGEGSRISGQLNNVPNNDRLPAYIDPYRARQFGKPFGGDSESRVGCAGGRYDFLELTQRNIGVDRQRRGQSERTDAADAVAGDGENLLRVEHSRTGSRRMVILGPPWIALLMYTVVPPSCAVSSIRSRCDVAGADLRLRKTVQYRGSAASISSRNNSSRSHCSSAAANPSRATVSAPAVASNLARSRA
jgi:hypothetical protein